MKKEISQNGSRQLPAYSVSAPTFFFTPVWGPPMYRTVRPNVRHRIWAGPLCREVVIPGIAVSIDSFGFLFLGGS